MAGQVTKLESPIDVMYLMHKAFNAQAKRIEALAFEGQDSGDLTEFKESFEEWVKQFFYHAATEDEYMTGPFKDSPAARDNEAEHVEISDAGSEMIEFLAKGDNAGLMENMTTAMVALDDKQHDELVKKTEEVEQILSKAMGETKVIGRTRRHLYLRVMSLRVLESDHFENEEAFILPMVRDGMSDEQELQLVRRLLVDDAADDPRWIIDWVARGISAEERTLVSDLEARLAAVSP